MSELFQTIKNPPFFLLFSNQSKEIYIDMYMMFGDCDNNRSAWYQKRVQSHGAAVGVAQWRLVGQASYHMT